MQRQLITRPEFVLMGISCRTNNRQEMDPATAKIGATIQHYFSQDLASNIVNRKNPGTTYCAYTEYEGDMTGDYTYFIGEAITSVNMIPTGFSVMTIPAQPYVKFTTNPGVMPNTCITAWQDIWAMSPEDLGGQRAYLADFEIYDDRARDPQQTILDIYVGLK